MAKTIRKSGRPSLYGDAKGTIRDAALTLFGERGFNGASVADIAAAAGVPKANVLYYYGSKDDLWRDAVDTLFADVDAFYAKSWPDDSPLSREGIASRLHVYLEACQRFPAYVQLNNLEGHADTWRSRWLAERHLRRHVATARAYYERLMAAGVLPRIDPTILQNILAGGGQLMIGQYQIWRITLQTDATPADFARKYVDNLLQLLIPEKGSPIGQK